MANTEEIGAEYGVCGLYVGHKDDIRAVCVLPDGTIVTGGRDASVKIWGKWRGLITEPVAEIRTASWVMSLCTIPEGYCERFPLGGFAIGCQDGDVLLVAMGDSAVGSVLRGHTAPVCSLSCWDGVLASGSWDETARLWNIDEESCTLVCSGHENQVCALLLPNKDLVTGSTGIPFQDPTAPSSHGVIEHKLRVWREGDVITTMTLHEAGIRGLALVRSDPIVFASASNDGSVKLWDESYSCIGTCKLGDDMVLAVCPGPHPELWTAVDMIGKVVVGDLSGNMIAEFQHSKSLWSVATSPIGGEIVTVGEDRVARVWVSNSTEALPQEDIQRAQEMALAAKQAAQTGKFGQTQMERLVASLPTDQTQYRAGDNAIALFKSADGKLVEACRYNNATKGWELLGSLQEPVKIK